MKIIPVTKHDYRALENPPTRKIVGGFFHFLLLKFGCSNKTNNPSDSPSKRMFRLFSRGRNVHALVGRKVNKTQNDACTAKIHYIVNKPYDDNYCYELDYEMCLDADRDTLMKDNTSNNSANIIVGTSFRTISCVPKRVWFIDTPGVNSSQNTIDYGKKKIWGRLRLLPVADEGSKKEWQ